MHCGVMRSFCKYASIDFLRFLLDDKIHLMWWTPNSQYFVLRFSRHQSDDTSMFARHRVLAIRAHGDKLRPPSGTDGVQKNADKLGDVRSGVSFKERDNQ